MSAPPADHSVTKDDIETWLQPILANLQLTNPKISLLGNTEKGDGYLGDISFVQVDGVQNGLEKQYNFVIKSGKKSETIRKVMPIKEAFKNEIYVYETLLPIFDKFQAEKGVKRPFNNTVKCYGTAVYENTEVLVLENMREKNYFLWNRKHPMDKTHIRKVVKTYGKLHALSFALRDQKPEVFQEISNNLVDIIKLINDMNNFEASENKATHWEDIINLAKSRNKPQIVDKVETCLANVIMPSPGFDSDPHFAILHGDCWNNNFMFTYSDEKREKLSEMCYLDLQLAKVSSPVVDLSYFLFTCTDPDDLVQNFDEILDCYYESFCEFLRELGSDPDKMFSHEAFLEQWKKYGKIGLLFLPSILKVCLADENEVTDFTDLKEEEGDLGAIFNYKIKNTKEYERRSLPVIQLAIDRGFLDE